MYYCHAIVEKHKVVFVVLHHIVVAIIGDMRLHNICKP